jgi:Flp pilus assembly protein TadD
MSKHFAEAEQVFNQAIALDPHSAIAHNDLASILRDLKNLPEAETAARVSYGIEPMFDNVLNRMAICKEVGDLAAVAAWEPEARKLAHDAEDYNVACLESILGNVDAALVKLKQAVAETGVYAAWAREDPDLAWLRADPRFWEIVGGEPPAVVEAAEEKTIA